MSYFSINQKFKFDNEQELFNAVSIYLDTKDIKEWTDVDNLLYMTACAMCHYDHSLIGKRG